MRRDINRFENGERLASYTGPAPSTYESGGKVRKDRKGTAEMDNVPVMNHVRMRGRFYQFFLIKRKKKTGISCEETGDCDIQGDERGEIQELVQGQVSDAML